MAVWELPVPPQCFDSHGKKLLALEQQQCLICLWKGKQAWNHFRCSRENWVHPLWWCDVCCSVGTHKWNCDRGTRLRAFFFKRPCPVIVSFTQRPNAICCWHPRLKPLRWLSGRGLSDLSVPTLSAVLHLWILMGLGQASHWSPSCEWGSVSHVNTGVVLAEGSFSSFMKIVQVIQSVCRLFCSCCSFKSLQEGDVVALPSVELFLEGKQVLKTSC